MRCLSCRSSLLSQGLSLTGLVHPEFTECLLHSRQHRGHTVTRQTSLSSWSGTLVGAWRREGGAWRRGAEQGLEHLASRRTRMGKKHGRKQV